MKLSFKMKLTLPVLSSVLIAFLFSSILIFSAVRQEAVKVGRESALHELEKQGNDIKGRIEDGLHVAKTLSTIALALSADGGTLNRERVMDMLVGVLEKNPGLYDAWVVWEPNRYNSSDSSFGEDNYVYNNKFFSPMAYRDKDSIVRHHAASMDKKGSNDWYQIPKRSGRNYMAEPTAYNINGKMTTLSTISVPFKLDGKVIGVAGVDIEVDYVKAVIDKIEKITKSYL